MGLGFMRRHNDPHPDKGRKGQRSKKDKGKGKGLSIVPINQPNVHNNEGHIQQANVSYDTEVLPGDAHTGTTGTPPGVPEPKRRHWSWY